MEKTRTDTKLTQDALKMQEDIDIRMTDEEEFHGGKPKPTNQKN